MRPQDTIDFNIRCAWQRISRMYNNEAAKYGTTMATGFVLLNIDKEEGTPSTKLGPKMGMEARSLTRILKSMEDKGLIYRRADEMDKRKVRICLTDEGERQRIAARDTVLKFNHWVYENFPKEKLDTFFEVMERLNMVLETEDIYNNVKV
ncbi:MAG: MarR family transcriptional regulator [Flavobacteriales bacterium]|nr:MarR family transcriptional regulator [Flavobacteriales bacterium]